MHDVFRLCTRKPCYGSRLCYNSRMKRGLLRSGSSLIIRQCELPLPGLVQCGMHRYSSAHHPIRGHVHAGAMEICYLSAGRQIIDSAGERHELHGNDLLITPPGALHGSSDQPAEKCALYYFAFRVKPPLLGFDAAEARRIIDALLSSPRRQCTGSARMKALFDEAFCAYRDQVPFFRGIITCRMMELLLEVVSAFSRHGNRAMPEAVARAVRFVDEHIGEAIDTAQLASAAGVSVPQIKRRFSMEVGVPPKEFILRRKITRAKELLAAGRLPVTEIALALGFSSSQHFATIFRRYAGDRPVDFRKKRG